jgi:class 3 adenylate cyclase/tetratricopeptide (TPR) repeat protein
VATLENVHLAELAAFLPRSHLLLLSRRGNLPTEATQEQGLAAVLFVDVTGFTAGVTEAFGHLGALGAEQLSHLIQSLFGEITDLIGHLGGDVLFYAGDSVMALWPEKPDGLALATWRASSCAKAIQRALKREQLGPEHARLGLRASVGAGPLTLLELGGVQERWYLLASGPPLLQVTQADRVAGTGEVVLSAEAWALIHEHGRATVREQGMVRLELLSDPPPSQPRESVNLEVVAPLLRHCVSHSVVDRVEAGQSRWLAEFRVVTVVFVHLLGETAALTTAETLQPALSAAFEILYRLGGNVYQLLADDKGVSLVAAFGLPPDAHENDPYRAIQAAWAMHEAITRAGLRPSIGVATGRVHCGVCGNDSRRQYSLVGPTLSFGARLMQAADGGILCDEATATAAGARGGSFAAAGTMQLKGRPRPVEVFRPIDQRQAVRAEPSASAPGTMVGRAEERRACMAAIEELLRIRRGGFILIEGEPGIGKSTLLADAVTASRERGIRALQGVGDEIERGTAYYAWRPVLAELLELGDSPHPATQIMQRWAERPDWLLRAPLLNAVIPLSIPETRLTEGVHGEARAEATRRLLLELLADSASRVPTVVALEDVHWLDESSSALLGAATERLDSILFLATSRPPDGEDQHLGHVQAPAEGSRLRLDGLTAGETRRLASRVLQVETIPDSIAGLIHSKAAGNPLFIQELALALRDFGVIEVMEGECRVCGAGTDPTKALENALQGRGLPGSVEGIIASRLDHLHPTEQLTARVASVVGPTFSLAPLLGVYPIAIQEAAAVSSLNELERRQLIRSDTTTPERAWSFRHGITRDVVYGTLPFAQRQNLHRAVAEWYEREAGTSQPQLFSTLAHHWRVAGDRRKAAIYLTEAGARSVEQFSNLDAVKSLTEAVALEEGLEGDGESEAAARARLARQLLLLGQAYLGLSQYPEVRRFLERGVALLGFRVPASGGRLGLGMLLEILRQARNRLWPGSTGRHSDRARLLSAAVAYEALAETFFYTGAEARTFYACLRTLNLAESAGPSAELARGYATMGTILSLVPARKLADFYGQRAIATADAVGQLAARPYVCVIVGIARAGMGDWQRAIPLFEEASRVAAELGDRRRWSDAVGHLAVIRMLQGDARSAQAGFADIYEDGLRAHDLRYQAEALCLRAYAELVLADFDGVRLTLAEIQAVVAAGLQSEVENTERHLAALFALWHARRGELEEAEGHFRRAAKLISAGRPADQLYYGFLSASATLDAGCVIYEATSEGGLLPPLRAVCRSLAGQARLFPVARPARQRHAGNLAWFSGRLEQALAEWRASIRLATALGMPLEAALAEFETGRHLSAVDPNRTELLTKAAETFLALGADHHHARVQAAIHSS